MRDEPRAPVPSMHPPCGPDPCLGGMESQIQWMPSDVLKVIGQ